MSAQTLQTDSGVDVTFPLSITATGIWDVGGPYGTNYNADGTTTTSVPEACAFSQTAPMGALIASTNGGTTWTLVVGVGPTIISSPGRLLLAINDCPPLGNYADNNGSQTVTILALGGTLNEKFETAMKVFRSGLLRGFVRPSCWMRGFATHRSL